jgi:ribosomal protein L7Ae-like RNA K-turn-binding protein
LTRAKRLLDLLGLAARAGRLVSGTDAVRGGVRDGKVRRVIMAADASDTQRRKLTPLLEARRVPYTVVLTRDALGAAIGRGPASAIGLTDANFAKRVGELVRGLSERDTEGGR